jgi:serine/threonine-protein kinase
VATSRIVEHVGRVLSDRYRLIRPLGTGASAHVYVAEDVTLRRRVAVKLLHPGLADDEAFLRRFQAEARVVAALRHPHIVRVYDWGDDRGSPFLVMELLEGGSLRSVLDRGHVLTPAQAARLGADTATALDYAHKRGLVHRDIKPANLLFDEDGQVSVADFGLARALAEATWTEPVGSMLGTARYAAPEQISGGALDGKADVYALALVLVEAVTGKVPFAADTTIGTLMARVDRDLPVPADLGLLGAAVAGAGMADPNARSDAAALAAGLAAAARQLPPPAPLPLASALDRADVEEDPDLTELPGRRRPFDAEAAERLPVGRPEPRAPLEPLAAPRPAPGRGEKRTAGAAPAGRRKRRWWPLALLAVLLVAGAAAAYAAWPRAKAKHPVPNLLHDTVAVAQQALRPWHFTLRTNPTYNDTEPVGHIISQAQAQGAVLPEGSVVAVAVSLGPPPVPVPVLVGLSEQDAKQRLIGAGLAEGTVTHRYDNTAAKGTVLSTSAGSAVQLTKGTAVDLLISDGPPVVRVPPVTPTQGIAGAQATLAAVGLKAVETDAFSTTVPKGQVISTNPAAGTSLTIGSTVTVTVSKGPDLVPVTDVHGQSVGAATQALQSAGFTVSGVTGNPLNTVVRTSPASGAMVLRGSAVTLFTG